MYVRTYVCMYVNLYLESIMGRVSKDMCGVEVSVSMPRSSHEESDMPGSVVVSESCFRMTCLFVRESVRLQ